MKKASQLTKSIIDLDKSVIAAVQGYAAGFSLAIVADFMVADRDLQNLLAVLQS